MTRLEALERVVKDIEKDTDSNIAWLEAFYDNPEHLILAQDAYYGSLDAASDLHNAALPDWFVARLMGDPEGKGWTCHLEPRNAPESDWIDGEGDTASEAFLIAILKALIADEQK